MTSVILDIVGKPDHEPKELCTVQQDRATAS